MNRAAKTQKTQVIILGGGITGLAAALFLRQQGVAFILLEKHSGTSIYPRSRTIDSRTMELFRGLGLSDQLREAGKALAPAWGIIRGKNMVEALQHPPGEPPLTPDQLMEAQQEMKLMAAQSPESVCRCTQDISEAVMEEFARKQGSDLRFHHELLTFEQDEESVQVWVKNRATGEDYAITATYMIAADGANSGVRQALNIPASGNFSGTDLLNIYFEADLTPWIKGHEFSQLLIDAADITGFLLTINNSDRWAFHLRYYPENGETAANYPTEKLVAILHRVLGIGELHLTILKVLPWKLTVSVAGRMRDHRIFLAGDAAHAMTPYAGKGANTGIQDVQNLAWKIAAVLQQHAGDSLLDTYNAERQPVDAFYATLSGKLANRNGLINDELMITRWKDLMGLPNFVYVSSAVKSSAGGPVVYFTGQPGTRIPHIWLDEARTISSLDWIKGHWVLVANQRGDWRAACELVEQQLRLPVRLVILDNKNVSERWKELTGTADGEALLIRPDDFAAAKVHPGELLQLMKFILSIVI